MASGSEVMCRKKVDGGPMINYANCKLLLKTNDTNLSPLPPTDI